MFIFRVIFGKIKDRFGEPLALTLAFSPLLLIHIFVLRPLLGPFVWLADCVFFGTPIGFFIANIIGRKAGGSFGDAVFYPQRYLKTAPHIMSPIKGNIARKEYDKAVYELDELLEEKPFSPEPYSILVELYANELNDYLRAMNMIEDYFSQEKVYVFDENVEMLLIYADLCQEHNYLKKAERLLEQEIKRKTYSDLERKRLETRLDAIKVN